MYIKAKLTSRNRLNALPASVGVVMTERRSDKFKITVKDPCQPYECKTVVFTAPKKAQPDVDLKIDNEYLEITGKPWGNSIHDLCIDNPLRRPSAEDKVEAPICGYPKIQLVTTKGEKVKFTTEASTDPATGIWTLKMKTNNCDRKETSENFKLRAFKQIGGSQVGEAFTNEFKVNFKNVNCNELPTFSEFPADQLILVPKKGVFTLTA